ncbi:LOW protein: E3 ubiquitin ligase-like protein [Actinidia rufa]|uniref:HECT-type E3 ubiquitin transferase n=2 Tax=asterids TaxID=71274 RepID=A0A7J0GP75_9ERIC|nr:LOW protein: E3 ubiquitin ligase-like protein [Actinidia rufa]
MPPKIRSFINGIIATPLEKIEEPLKGFIWEFEKGDFHHWVDLFNHFDTFFEKNIKSRRDLRVEDDFLESDPPFPREAVLQILRVTRIILENCTNKHFYSSYEHHLSSLLASTDADVVEACLQTLAAFLKKTIGKYIIRDSTLNSKLFAFAQGWGGKEEGLGLITCAIDDGSEPIANELGSTLHFEFYAANELSNEIPAAELSIQGLQIIHLPNINTHQESDLELLNKLVIDYKVPLSLRFSLWTRLRFARGFISLSVRQQYTCIRLYAFIVLAQACGNTDDLVSFFDTEPDFISELVSLLSYDSVVPEKIRILSLLALVALCLDRSRQPSVLTAVTSGGHRGILSSLMQKAIDSVVSNSSKWSVVFAEALLSLVTVLVSSSSGCSAMREAGFIPTLLPLLKDTDPQHLHLVSMAVHVLEAFMDYSNPAAALFRDLGGLDDTISRLKIEISYFENVSKQQGASIEQDSSECSSTQVVAGASTDLDNMNPLYSEALVAYHRRLLVKALLHAISLGTYAPGSTALISFIKTLLVFPVLEAAGLLSAFLDAIMDGVLCSAEAITCIPQCLDALCLNNNGLQAVKDRNALRCFVKIFTSRSYLRVLTGDTPGSLSSGLDELMRHASSLRGPGVDMLVEILNTIAKIGSGVEAASLSTDAQCSSTSVPMETDADEGNSVPSDDKGSCKVEKSDQSTDATPDASLMSIESFFPDCISNAARLLETVLQNSDTCRIFVEKKGIEAILQLFTLSLMPLSMSIGQSISVAFKNFSSQNSASLARAVCSFLREHLKSTNELLVSVGGMQLAQLEASKQTKVLRSLSSLEGILSLSNSLLKGTTTVVSELGAADADVLKDLGRAYREILWQISLCCDSKVDEKQKIEVESASAVAALSNALGRESDDDANIPVVRYTNPLYARNGSQFRWGGERNFLSVTRSGEGFNRRSRHGLTRLRGGRAGSHIEALNIDSEASGNAPETTSQDMKKQSPDVLVSEILNRLASILRSFFSALVKGFTSPNRRRPDSGLLNSVSKSIGTALAKVFLEAFSFSGYPASAGIDMSLSVKCRYLGKVVGDMAALTFDNKRRTCYTAMVNNFYAHGTFRELLTTFEATSQLLWTLPCSIPTSGVDHEVAGEGSKLSQNSWLLDTLQSYCRLLEYFVNSSLLLSSTSASQVQLLVQPVAVGLSIGLFPVPREPEVFVRMLQSQVLDAILPLWNHPMFPSCRPGFITSIVSLVTHVYSGVGDMKRNRSGASGSTNQRFVPPPPDEATIATIVEMGFTRERAEEALRRVETNSVEMAMEWLFSHVEDPVQDDDELIQVLALSLGSSSEISKIDSTDKSMDVLTEVGQTKAPPVDDILAAAMKFLSSDSMAFVLTDLLVTLCNRNKGEDRPRVTSYLTQQLKLCPLEFTNDTCALSMVSHILALLLSEDGYTREIAAQNGIVSIAIDILLNFRDETNSGSEILAPKCISTLLLILDNLLQSRPRVSSDITEGISAGRLPHSSAEHASFSASETVTERKPTPAHEEESETAFEKIFGKSTGYLTIEESHRVLAVACDLIKQHVPAVVMQAVLQLCARLTKTHSLALLFLEKGGTFALLSLPRSCFFPGYDTLASTIIRHLLEDPQTLQTAMELEIRQTLSGNRHAGRVYPRTFLTSMAPVISRDPGVFLKAATSVCQLESSGGRTVVVLSKEKEKEKDKSKASGVEIASSNEYIKTTEITAPDAPGKSPKGQKKISANLAQVIDQLLEILLKYPSPKRDRNCASSLPAMEVDEPVTKVKGKSKVDETRKIDSDNLSERSASLAKATFVLKLLGDILLLYVQAVGVILRRDSDICQFRGFNQLESPGHGGILHHVLHWLLPLSTDKNAGSDEWRSKLSEKASWFLVVLCGRSSEGRRRVINELVKALSSFSKVESNSSNCSLLPDKRVLAFADLVNSILSKNSSSSNLPGSGCSPDIAKSMIDGGMIQSLTGVLQAIDLDHPDAPELVNLILQALESLTRAAYASEQGFKSDALKKKSIVSNGRSNDQMDTRVAESVVEPNQNRSSQQDVTDAADVSQQHIGTSHNQGDNDSNPNQVLVQEMRIDVEEADSANPPMGLGLDFMHEEIEGGEVLNNRNQIAMTFHVENRADDDMGDEDDDIGEDGEDDDDDDEGEDEDENIVADGTGLMSLADTDVEDHDDTGLRDEYNDDMVDEEDDDFHENRVIELRWREALDGLDHLQVLGQPGAASGLIDVAAETFEGVNVDDLFGLRRPLGFERRRQTSRTSFERSVTEGNGLQHPLLSRPSQSGDLISMWSSGGNSSRDMGPSTRSFDVAHFFMFDAPVLPYDHVPASLFGDRLGAAPPPPLTDFSVGLGRRGPGDGRWTDDGQPQAGGLASAIAQAMEEQFISQLRSIAPEDTPAERQSHNLGLHESQQSDVPLTNDNQLAIVVGSTGGQHPENDAVTVHPETSQMVESVPYQGQGNPQVVEDNERLQECEPMSNDALSENNALNGPDIMDIGEGNRTLNEQDLVRDRSSATDSQSSTHALLTSGFEISNPGDCLDCSVNGTHDVDMNGVAVENNQVEQRLPSEVGTNELLSGQNSLVAQDAIQTDQTNLNNEAPNANGIDPTFLEALPEDLRAEVLASQQAQSAQVPTYAPPSADDIDPEFLAALPPEIQAEVLAQQRAQRVAQQAEGQPVDMDNASIIATFPADLREEVLLTSSDAVLSALPSPLLAEAQMLRDRVMSHYQAHSLFGTSHRLNTRRNGLGFDRQTVMDRGVGVTVGRRAFSAHAEGLKLKEIEGEPLLDAHALKALIRLLRLAQPLRKGLLQRLLLNLCANSVTRPTLVRLLLDMIKPETESSVIGLTAVNSQRLYGCQSIVVYGRSQLVDGLPPLVLRRVLEILTYLATNHSTIANILFHFDFSPIPDYSFSRDSEIKKDKGKEKIEEGGDLSNFSVNIQRGDVPLILLLKLLGQPLFIRSSAHLEQVMDLILVVVCTAASNLDCQFHSGQAAGGDVTMGAVKKDMPLSKVEANHDDKNGNAGSSTSDGKRGISTYNIFLQLPQADLHNVCSLLGREGLSDKVYTLADEVMEKLALVAAPHRNFFISELSELAHSLSSSATSELMTLRNTQMLGLSAGSMAGHAILRVLQTLSSLASSNVDGDKGMEVNGELEEHAIMFNLSVALESLWQGLSDCISSTEAGLTQSSFSSILLNTNVEEHVSGSSSLSPPLPPGTLRLLPFIEAFFVLCEKLQANNVIMQQDHTDITAREVKEFAWNSAPSPTKCGFDSQKRLDSAVTFGKFAEKHRRLLNAFVRQNPSLLEKTLSMMLKAPRLIDFDNKRAYFRSRIRQQHEQHLPGPLQISVRRAYVLEDSYNQLRMRSSQDLKRLYLTRELYFFTTVGNDATFQPNPNSVYQTEHLSYFKFVGRVVAKALFDGQLFDVYFTRSFYKHILGVKVTYYDIEAVDPDYYKNLKWMLENDVSDIPDLTFSMDADEEKHILYEKTEVTDYELKPGGRNIRVTEETKHEYVDLVADHILTNAIRPQINSFLEGFNELIPRELISLFNDKELELLINGLPEIDSAALRVVSAHENPDQLLISAHTWFATGHWKNRWFNDSTGELHREHENRKPKALHPLENRSDKLAPSSIGESCTSPSRYIIRNLGNERIKLLNCQPRGSHRNTQITEWKFARTEPCVMVLISSMISLLIPAMKMSYSAAAALAEIPPQRVPLLCNGGKIWASFHRKLAAQILPHLAALASQHGLDLAPCLLQRGTLLDDLMANTEYTGYTAASGVVQWFWDAVPLEGFKALQGISGPQRFQIHKAYGAPERLPSAHTCFNQLDLPEYTSKEQLQERLLLAIHEASEGFGFG